MIPKVFVSSTIEDLRHLREVLRDTIKQLGYQPVMSDHGEVPYLSTISVMEAGPQEVKQCQLAVLIVGKRYGSTTADGTSITELEYRAATENDVPVYTLVDKVVLNYKDTYDANPADKKLDWPGMDQPTKTFELLRRITGASVGNAILAYSDASDAARLVKQQFALLFGDLLEKQFGEVNRGLKDVLSEIMALRRELSAPGAKEPDRRFLKGIRFLLRDNSEELRRVINALGSEIDEAVPVACDAATFDAFVTRLGGTLVVETDTTVDGGISGELTDVVATHSAVVGYQTVQIGQQPRQVVPLLEKWCVTTGRQVVTNTVAKEFFDKLYNELRHRILWPANGGEPDSGHLT